mmetsp:Transcript_25764/g.89722  ORF Transcript_25764/g.89722 Transcript_25764/m.89722 type:complete len:229 (-) Transcript_25764:23-709(-)
MAAAAKRGAFILLEGVDRAGKSTQAKALVAALNAAGRPAELRRFPDRTTAIGSMISSYLKMSTELDDHAVHLLFAANRWEAAAELTRKLEEGTTLVVDRYSYSGVAFSAAKEGMSVEWCRAPERGLPAPDVVLFLDLSVEEAAARGGFGEERYEVEEFQRRVRKNFSDLRDGSWVTVNAARTEEEVAAEIKAVALAAADEAAGVPVRKLWVDGEAGGKGGAGAGGADA